MTKPVEAAVQEFLRAYRAEGRRPATIKWYRHMLKPFVARFYGRDVEHLTAHDLRQYVIELRERDHRYENAPQRPIIKGGLSNESIRDHFQALRRFFNWCVIEYDLNPQRNPMSKIRMPARQQPEPKAIALDDLRRLMQATDASPFGVRDRAILAFLTDTGCRAGGLLSLQLTDLDLNRLMAVVREKGDRPRAVPFMDYTADLLRAWLLIRPTDVETVFCSLGGRSPGQPLTLAGLHLMLKRLKSKAGVTGRVNPHAFRHGFARQYLLNGGDPITLAQIMGHSSVTTTERYYARFTAGELAAMHKKLSPIVNLLEMEHDHGGGPA